MLSRAVLRAQAILDCQESASCLDCPKVVVGCGQLKLSQDDYDDVQKMAKEYMLYT